MKIRKAWKFVAKAICGLCLLGVGADIVNTRPAEPGMRTLDRGELGDTYADFRLVVTASEILPNIYHLGLRAYSPEVCEAFHGIAAHVGANGETVQTRWGVPWRDNILIFSSFAEADDGPGSRANACSNFILGRPDEEVAELTFATYGEFYRARQPIQMAIEALNDRWEGRAYWALFGVNSNSGLAEVLKSAGIPFPNLSGRWAPGTTVDLNLPAYAALPIPLTMDQLVMEPELIRHQPFYRRQSDHFTLALRGMCTEAAAAAAGNWDGDAFEQMRMSCYALMMEKLNGVPVPDHIKELYRLLPKDALPTSMQQLLDDDGAIDFLKRCAALHLGTDALGGRSVIFLFSVSDDGRGATLASNHPEYETVYRSRNTGAPTRQPRASADAAAQPR